MKISICASLALHLLMVTTADKMGSASILATRAKPTVIEVALGKPSMIEVALGGGPKAVQQVRDCGKSAHLRRKPPAYRLTKTARLEAKPPPPPAPPLPAPSPPVAETAVKEVAAPVSSPIPGLVSGESTATVDNVIRSAGAAPSAGSERAPGQAKGRMCFPM
jgi:hypothetical protein